MYILYTVYGMYTVHCTVPEVYSVHPCELLGKGKKNSKCKLKKKKKDGGSTPNFTFQKVFTQ